MMSNISIINSEESFKEYLSNYKIFLQEDIIKI